MKPLQDGGKPLKENRVRGAFMLTGMLNML